MTIQRQYSLPNCTLVLDGLSDPTATTNPTDIRPLMSILINAECRFVGFEQPLTGGRDFFISLVTAVSRYAQEFFSGIRTPESEPSLVRLQRLGLNQHRLLVQPPSEATDAGSSTQVDLTTVQLFDLVEAVDQFFADAQTLPDVMLKISPVSKRYAPARQTLAQRAVPAAIGTSSLALAAIALFFVPIPEVQKPQEQTPQANNPSQTQTPTPTGAASSPPSDPASPSASPTESPASPSPTSAEKPDLAEIQAALATAPEITDPTELDVLGRKLYGQVKDAWETSSELDQELTYQVSVGKDGAILGYKEAEPTPVDAAAQKTPLLDLLYIPASGGSVSKEPVGQFKVVFKPGGTLEVSPWGGYSADPSPAPAIADPSQVEDLTGKLYDQIDKNWTEEPPFENELVYRVVVAPNGAVVNYEPVSQSAYDYVQDTPLPNLVQPNAAIAEQEGQPTQASQAEFKVVFKPSGVLQVSPWGGYQEP